MKLDTIQKQHKLNDVYRTGELCDGGVGFFYAVGRAGEPDGIFQTISFQNGPRKDESSEIGVLDCDLLEIVRDRLKAFQQGELATRENACALTHIEEALMWMNKRVEDRAARGVLGTMKK